MLVIVGMVIVIGTLLSTDLELPANAIERGEVDSILPILAANTTPAAIVVWVEVIIWTLLAIYGIDLYRILPDDSSGLLFAPVAFIGGSALFIVELLLLLGISQGLAPAYAGATGAEQTVIEGTALALLQFRNRLLLVAGVLYALAVISFGREMLRSSAFPNWMGYLGFAVGVSGVIGGFFPLFAPLFAVRSLGLGLLFIWVLIAGIILLRRR